MKFRLTVLACLMFSLIASAAPGKAVVHVTADSTSLTMGDLTNVVLTVVKDKPEGVLVDPPQLEKDYFGLELVKSTVDSTQTANGQTELTYNMKFQAFYPTELLTIPPFRYSIDGDTAYSDILTFKVYPVELSPELGSIEDPENLTIHPDEGPVTVPSRWYDYVPDWVVWVILALAAIALICVLYLLYKKNGPAIFIQRKPTPPYELAVQRLTSLKQKKLLDQGQVKQYYTELIDIFRNYLEGRFGINAMEMPSKTILKRIRENKEIHLTATQMEQVLQLADFVKFAAANPTPEEGLRTFNTISSFVESTKPLPEPESETDEKTPKKR